LIVLEAANMSDDALKLKYVPTSRNLAPFTARGEGWTRESDFLAVTYINGKATGFLVHGNSEIKVIQRGREVQGNYKTWRRMRVWQLAAGGGFNPEGPVEFDWLDDAKSNTPNWTDIPALHETKLPDKWKEERHLLEFAVGVVDHLDEGLLYFYVVISEKRAQYRVQMSSSADISLEDWKTIKKSAQPWAPRSDCGIELDTMWLTCK
jgi:hypothetical protein